MRASWHPALATVNPLFRGGASLTNQPDRDIPVSGHWRDFSSGRSVPNLSAISGANLFAGLLFSSIGFVGFVYGKRMSAWKPLFIGIVLMAYPYFIESTLLLCAIGVAGSTALYFFRD